MTKTAAILAVILAGGLTTACSQAQRERFNDAREKAAAEAQARAKAEADARDAKRLAEDKERSEHAEAAAMRWCKEGVLDAYRKDGGAAFGPQKGESVSNFGGGKYEASFAVLTRRENIVWTCETETKDGIRFSQPERSAKGFRR